MGSKTITQITATQTTINDTDNFILQETGGGTTKKTLWSTIKSNIGVTPVGTVIESAAISAPTGWLSCNGAAVSRTTYSALYGAITANLGTVTITSANPGVVSLTAHGLSTGSCIELTTTGALPTALSANTNYYVIYVGADSFRLATSAANAIAGTAIDTSGGSPSGTHTLRYCPFGISGASNFLLPDHRGVVAVGAGSQTINTRAKTAVLGLVEEDQMQTITGTFGIVDNDVTSLPSAYSVKVLGTGAFTAGTEETGSYFMNTGASASGTGYRVVGFSSANSTDARTGTTTRENRIGMNYYIKY